MKKEVLLPVYATNKLCFHGDKCFFKFIIKVYLSLQSVFLVKLNLHRTEREICLKYFEKILILID